MDRGGKATRVKKKLLVMKLLMAAIKTLPLTLSLCKRVQGPSKVFRSRKAPTCMKGFVDMLWEASGLVLSCPCRNLQEWHRLNCITPQTGLTTELAIIWVTEGRELYEGSENQKHPCKSIHIYLFGPFKEKYLDIRSE